MTSVSTPGSFGLITARSPRAFSSKRTSTACGSRAGVMRSTAVSTPGIWSIPSPKTHRPPP